MSPERRRFRGRLLVGLIVGLGLLLVLLANIHLLYVAFISQPECVEHIKVGNGTPGSFAAATSAC